MIAKRTIWPYFYPLLTLFCLISMFSTTFKVGIFFAFLMVLYIVKISFNFRKISICDCLVLMYGLWSAISILWATGNNSTTYYIYGMVYSIMPTCFYFYARQIGKETAHRVLVIIMRTIAIAMIIGLVLYIIAPVFYADFLYSRLLIPNTSLYQVRKMFQGIFGVTITASLCAFWALYEWHGFLENKKKHIIFLLLSLVLLAMTARKSAIFILLILIGLESLISSRIKSKICRRLIVVVLLLVIAIITMESFFPTLYYEIIERFSLENILLGLTQRSDAISLTLQNLNNYLIGNGLGSSGHRAGMENTISLYAYDNSYLLLLCETGAIGLLLFVLIAFSGLVSGYSKRRTSLLELEIVFILIIQSWTSNMFEFIYITPLFWYFLGRCCTNNQVDGAIEKELRIINV